MMIGSVLFYEMILHIKQKLVNTNHNDSVFYERTLNDGNQNKTQKI